MRYMMIVKATEASEAAQMPTEAQLTEMGAYNEELVKAGVLLAGEGLRPSSEGARVGRRGGDRVVIDGPFAETKELIAGFWIIQVPSREAAIEWASRVPLPEGQDIEVRRIAEAEDFGEEFTPELREAEDALRTRIEQQQS